MLIRALAVLLLFASCDRGAERRLIATWRSEKDGAVDELALGADHKAVWWMCPEELSTPQTFVSSGKWYLRGKHIEIDWKPLTSGASAEHHSLRILNVSNDALLVKPANEHPVQFRRLDVPSCGPPAPGSTPVDVEPNIPGTWQVHYHTHELRYHFAPDHTVTVSGLSAEDFHPLWKGLWSVAQGDLLMDLNPDSAGMSGQKQHLKLYRFQRDCFWIKDPEGVEYAVHRTE